ncbi:hypothetical protein [Brevibacterium linens]|uniref:hypothetical protein n=1 Tax=Brevibacterium linens TaxID=1703 RepID=UPI003BF48758
MSGDFDLTGGRPTGEPVSGDERDVVLPDRQSLNDAELVMARLAVDDGERTDLDQAMKGFGISRGDLETEIDAGLHET